MRQTTPTLPISPKLLRHFAVVTVAVTAMLGVFAQGENEKVAAAPSAAPAGSGGGSFMDFGGAEKAALAGPAKEPGPVGGMQVAKGTNLQGDDGGGGDGSGGSADSGAGSIQTAPPTPRRIIFGPGVRPPADVPTASDGPPPMPKDAHGVPAPGVAAIGVGVAAGAKPQAPRRPTAQDVQRVLAASGQRSGNSIQ